MPVCKFKGCSVFAKTAYNLSKHHSQCKYRCIQTRSRLTIAEYAHEPASKTFVVDEHTAPLPLPEQEPIEEDSPTAHNDNAHENLDCIRRPGCEVLNDTIILSLNSVSRSSGPGLASDLIAVLRDDEFSLELFRERVRNVAQIRKLSACIMKDSMKSYGFLTKDFEDASGTFSGTLYLPGCY